MPQGPRGGAQESPHRGALVRACVRALVCACVRACVPVCVRACVRALVKYCSMALHETKGRSVPACPPALCFFSSSRPSNTNPQNQLAASASPLALLTHTPNHSATAGGADPHANQNQHPHTTHSTAAHHSWRR